MCWSQITFSQKGLPQEHNSCLCSLFCQWITANFPGSSSQGMVDTRDECRPHPPLVPWQTAERSPRLFPEQCSRKPLPPIRVGMRWSHSPRHISVCVHWLCSCGDSNPSDQGLVHQSPVLHIPQPWFCCFVWAKQLAYHTHSHRKNIRSKPTTTLFTFCPAT